MRMFRGLQPLITSLAFPLAAAASGLTTGCYLAKENVSSEAATTPNSTANEGAPSKTSLGDRRLRRLTRDEYTNTLRDLLGVPESWGDALPADTVVDGFDTNGDSLTVGNLFVDKARSNAEQIVETLDLTKLAPCAGSALNATCVETVLRDFGTKVFRRSLRDEERKRYVGLFRTVESDEGSTTALRAVVAAMLQSPSFLYRTELGETTRGDMVELSSYEIASELSYLLWKSMPDAELLALAAKDELRNPEVVANQAERMLASEKSSPMLERFVDQWLELDRLSHGAKDAKTFPDFDDALQADLRKETVLMFENIAKSEAGTFEELLMDRSSFLSPRLAAFYGVTLGKGPAVKGFIKSNLPDHRTGILSRGAILATQATPSSGSPVRRGALVRTKFLCQPLPPPPPGVAVQLPAVAPNVSNRQRFQEHSSNPACASCHQLMDPVGFGFEGFDGIGRFLAGADVSGEVVGSVTLGGKFNGVAELSSKMAKSPEVHECFIRQWIKFGYGISESPDSLLLAKKMGEGFASSGTRIHSMVVALTQVDPFYRRRGAPGAVSADPVSSGPTPPPSASVPAATPPSPSSSAGTTPPPSGDPSSSSPSSPMTPVSLVSGIDVTQVRDVEQSGGIQKEVTVKNVGAAPLEWKVKFPKRGTLVHQWNTEVSVQGTDWVFSGKDYNRTVAPGQTATFGFITKD